MQRSDRDPDAGRQMQLMTRNRERPADHVDQGACPCDQLRHRRLGGKQDREFIAAEPAEQRRGIT